MTWYASSLAKELSTIHMIYALRCTPLFKSPYISSYAGAQVETSWCRHSQFHTAVAYRGLLRAVAAGGPLELSAAIAGSVYEGMEILIRNAEDKRAWLARRALTPAADVLRASSEPSPPKQSGPNGLAERLLSSEMLFPVSHRHQCLAAELDSIWILSSSKAQHHSEKHH
eukprot:scaffold164548_cov31-Prasinocladus_malaysianus.AAC.2